MIAALPLAVVAELGSILLPVPVFVMSTTGDDVKNLHTPTIVALTVTLTLSLACAAGATNIADSAAAANETLIEFFTYVPLEWLDNFSCGTYVAIRMPPSKAWPLCHKIKD